MRLIDADALIERLEVYPVYNGMADMDDIMTIVSEMPTAGKDVAEALECFRRYHFCLGGIECEQTKCKWRCDGRAIGLDHGYCAGNNLLGDVVRLLGGEPGKGVSLRGKAD